MTITCMCPLSLEGRSKRGKECVLVHILVFALLIVMAGVVGSVIGQCPWGRVSEMVSVEEERVARSSRRA